MKITLVFLFLLVFASFVRGAAPHIEVEALFPNAAVITVAGQRKMMRVGDTFQGVTLLASYSRTATLVYEGEEMVLGISRRIGTNYQEPQDTSVKITRNTNLQYRTTARINGRNAEVLVDTGANIVAMNSTHARNLGVDSSTGKASQVETASGVVSARLVTLRSVSVGGIRVQNVQASVIEGTFPATILLGMTFLQHVDIQEEDGVLSLTRNW